MHPAQDHDVNRRRVRILGLAADASALPERLPAPGSLLDVTLLVGCAGPVERRRPYPVRHLVGARPQGPRQSARAAGAWAKTQWSARRGGASADLVWRLKRSIWVRRQLRDVDLVVSLDAAIDAALAAAPNVAAEVPVLRAADSAAVWSALTDLESLLGLVQAAADRGRDDDPGHREEQVQTWQALVAGLCRPSFPTALLPVEPVAALGRELPGRLGVRPAAEVVSRVLDLPPWPATERGRSGLAAQRATADLWLAETADQVPDDDQLAEAAAAALAGADAALVQDQGVRALGRLSDALSLLFHRERHAEVEYSPLVSDPGAFLAPLWESAVHRRLVRARIPGSRSAVQSRSGRDVARVLVLTGAYGQFHGEVVTALSQEADVRVLNPGRLHRMLAKRSMDLEVLQRLALLHEDRPMVPGLPAADAADRRLAGALRKEMQGVDVVFSDWADRSTVWASHLRPEHVRLVVRIHSLDALDPWFHLVNWSGVDEVIVVSEPLRSLVVDLLTVTGARVPVTVLPNLVRLKEMAALKEPSARTTLGMVGWGRRVKDPLWALELLAREPTWRMLLIGADFAEAASGSGARYTATVRQRLLDPDVRDRVELVEWTPDVAHHLRRVGVILSTSVRESWHIGLVEGAASGAVPVVRNWPLFSARGGARALFPPEWVVEDLDAAEARVRDVTARDAWLEHSARARAQALDLFDPEAAADRYRQVILGRADD